MNTIYEKLNTLKYPYHFLTYAITFLFYGSIISAIGPLIPYLTHLTGIPQTGYSFLFLSRSLGFIAGGFLLQALQQKYTFHTILSTSNIFMFGFTFMFSIILSPISQAIWIFFISVICCIYQVLINISILQTQKTGRVQFWVPVAHTLFGLGGWMGPLFVYFFQQYCLGIMGFLAMITVIGYMRLKSPQAIKQNTQTLENNQNKSLIKDFQVVSHAQNYQIIQTSEQQQFKVVNKSIEYVLCFIFFVYVGLQTIYGSWISSFAVLSNVATKQQATRFSSIFWLTVTIFRLGFSFVNISTTKKFFMHIEGLLLGCVITILLIWTGLPKVACYFSAISFGVAFSSLFPILFSISSEYKMKITSTQSARFMIWTAIGEGVLSTLTGYLMEWATINMLFYSILLITIGFYISAYTIKRLFEQAVFQDKIIKEVSQQRKIMGKQMINLNGKTKQISYSKSQLQK